MANTILTNSIIVNESLLVAKNMYAKVLKRMTRAYEDEFGKKGYKVGDTVSARLPMQYTVTDGETMTPQDTEEKSVPIVVDTQKNIGMQFGDAERTLKLDMFRERYIEPAVMTLVDTSFQAILQNSYKSIANSVGIPHATNLPNSTAPFGRARALLASRGTPMRDLTSVIDPFVEDSLVAGGVNQFNPATEISKQYLDGEFTRAAGQDFFMSQLAPKHTVGPLGGTPLVNGATASGATTIVSDGWTAAAASRLKKGDVISLAGVNSVNPITKSDTGQLAQFVVTADVSSDGSGNASIPISPAIISTGAYQNVTALPADNAAITIFGHASSYANVIAPQNLVFHKQAIAVCFVPLEKIEGEEMEVATDPETGLSVRLWTAGNILTGKGIKRLDILFGSKVIRPEFACRVVGRLS